MSTVEVHEYVTPAQARDLDARIDRQYALGARPTILLARWSGMYCVECRHHVDDCFCWTNGDPASFNEGVSA